MAKRHLKLVSPATVNRTVRPRRRPNGDLRTREYLTEAEVERLMKAANRNRWGHRDATMILVTYRHGLRAAELVDLRWDQIEFRTANLHVRRVKQGTPSTHPILGDELRALRRLQREQQSRSPFVFTSERGAPFSPAGFARMIERVGILAKLGFKAHPHMLRHACGYKLANDGHDTRALQAYLGHKNIQHTVRYTELAPTRFKRFLAQVIAAKGGPRLQQIAEHPLELEGFIASELAMSADLLASTKFKISGPLAGVFTAKSPPRLSWNGKRKDLISL